MTGMEASATGVAAMSAEDVKRSLIRLGSWPDLSFVSETSQVRVARICGLLSRKPTVGHLIPRVLGESDEVVLTEVLRLVRIGHLHVVGAGSGMAEQNSAFASLQTNAVEVPQPVKRSLVAKLWAKFGL